MINHFIMYITDVMVEISKWYSRVFDLATEIRLFSKSNGL
jgi:hypothetical protein